MSEAQRRLETAIEETLAVFPEFRVLVRSWVSSDPVRLHLRVDLLTPDSLPARLELVEIRDPDETPLADGGPTRYWYALHSENRQGERLYQGRHLHREAGEPVALPHRSERVDGVRADWGPDVFQTPMTAVSALLTGYARRHALRANPLPSRERGETMRAYRRRKLALARLALA